MPDPVLEMRNITKRFPGVLANDKVNLTLFSGEVHALLGENGAGKSTLMNILSGIYFPNEGDIFLKGKQVSISSPKQAVELGIGMVHQQFRLVETLSVAENIFLGSSRCKSYLSQQEMNEAVHKCSEQYGLLVDPSSMVWRLSMGEQQRVEILKLLFCGAELLILDEPTSVLTPQESSDLFKALHEMARKGKDIMFITHKMNEVMNFADRITVLRSGRSVATLLKGETNIDDLTNLMVGHSLEKLRKTSTNASVGDDVMVLDKVNVTDGKRRDLLKDISLTIRKGEILAVAGVAGNGQRELAEVVTGLMPPNAGTLTLNGKDITGASPKQFLNSGVAFVPQDRMGIGLVGEMNMLQNVLLRNYDKPEFNKYGLIRRKAVAAKTNNYVKTYDIKNSGAMKPISLMSGGNLQKLLVAREVDGQPLLIIAASPVQGLDIAATDAIHKILLEQRNKGAAILMISEDLDHIFELSDRIAVMFEGRLMDVLQTASAEYEQVGKLMLGVANPFQSEEEMI